MITITDIAAKAGVSRATVSYVLNGQNTAVRISDETRERVLNVAAELGYRRNQLARAVITGQSRMLGLWVMQSQHEPVARVLSGIMQEADDNDFFVKLVGFDDYDEHVSVAKVVERCIEWRLTGIIAVHAPERALDALQPHLSGVKVPLIVVDSQAPRENVVHVTSDQEAALAQIVEHLAGLGHQRIAFVAGGTDEAEILSWRRIHAYERAMEKVGLREHIHVGHGNWDHTDTIHLAEEWLSKPAEKRPTAIACWSDITAMLFIQTAARLGLRIPQDLSVTGFDDSRAAALYNPPLTTVAQSFEEMGRRALRHLLAAMSQTETELLQGEDQLETELVIRGSTAPPA